MFEHRKEAVLPRRQFLLRMLHSGTVATVLVIGSLAIGMVGYHITEKLDWIDSFLNASMLLGGMGPVDAPKTFDGKLFAGMYSLYCGLLVILIAGVILAPVAHRVLHKFHVESEES